MMHRLIISLLSLFAGYGSGRLHAALFIQSVASRVRIQTPSSLVIMRSGIIRHGLFLLISFTILRLGGVSGLVVYVGTFLVTFWCILKKHLKAVQ